jgi:hypothetical protein
MIEEEKPRVAPLGISTERVRGTQCRPYDLVIALSPCDAMLVQRFLVIA